MESLTNVTKEQIFLETCIKKLVDNEEYINHWKNIKSKYEEVITNLKFYNEKYKPAAYIPFGSKAFLKGNLVNTNNVMVTLGCGLFLKTSTKKAVEICERKIKEAVEQIEKWEKENALLESMKNYTVNRDIFGNNELKDIKEEFDEEKEKEWRIEHKKKERKYRQEIKELREETASETITNEDDLWYYLDKLELQEELEDELNRLGFDGSNEEYESDSSMESEDSVESDSNVTVDCVKQDYSKGFSIKEQDLSCSEVPTNNKSTQKRVTFANIPEATLNEPEKENKVSSSVVISNVVERTAANLIYGEREPTSTRPLSRFKMSILKK